MATAKRGGLLPPRVNPPMYPCHQPRLTTLREEPRQTERTMAPVMPPTGGKRGHPMRDQTAAGPPRTGRTGGLRGMSRG